MKDKDGRIYLDYAATTPPDPAVVKKFNEVFGEIYGNSESLHTIGKKAAEVLENARFLFAAELGVKPFEIIFTSGGTESDNIAIQGTVRHFMRLHPDDTPHVIASSIEHQAVLRTCKYLESNGIEVTYLPVDKYGMVDPADVEDAIRPNTALITVMYANNEIGTIEPIGEIGKIARKHNIPFHTDAVQAFGKLEIKPYELGIDMLSASAHKIYGPKGVGLLFLRNCGFRELKIDIPPSDHPEIRKFIEENPGCTEEYAVFKYMMLKFGEVTEKTDPISQPHEFYCEPLMYGGHHEFGWRPSTVNVPGIAAFAEAFRIMCSVRDEEMKRLAIYKKDLIDWVENTFNRDGKKTIIVNGHPDRSLPNIVNFGVYGLWGKDIFMGMDLEKIAISTGSACSSQSKEVSHVIRAINPEPEYAGGTIRISMGRFTEKEHIEKFKKAFKLAVYALRKIRNIAETK